VGPSTTATPTAAAAAIPAQSYITWETDFGPARSNYWQGVDFTVNARMRQGLTLQFGTNTGREIEDDCATVVKIDSPDPRNCRQTPPYQTTVRGLASYTIPRVDVLVSAAVRSQPPLRRLHRRVGPVRRRDRAGRLEWGHVPALAPLREAAVTQDEKEPPDELVGVAALRQLVIGPHERILHGVLGGVRGAQHQRRVARVAVPVPRDELGVALGVARQDRPYDRPVRRLCPSAQPAFLQKAPAGC